MRRRRRTIQCYIFRVVQLRPSISAYFTTSKDFCNWTCDLIHYKTRQSKKKKELLRNRLEFDGLRVLTSKRTSYRRISGMLL